ncbi:MAG TPA: ankyrin repeat domain-containing protein [Pyrinomonadaceae bacterium]
MLSERELNLQLTAGNRSRDFLCAALNGQTSAIEAMLEKGVAANTRDSSGRTALMFATANLHISTVKVLLAAGASADASDRDGCTALLLAASSGHPEIVRVLLAANDGKTALRRPDYTRALCLARRKGLTRIVRMLSPGH